MRLSAIKFENYKAFHGRQSLEIRPLTILIGRNSSGKSVVARLPLIIARGLSESAWDPVDLEFDGMDFGASFLDLIHGRSPHGAVGIGAKFTSKQGAEFVEFTATIQHIDEYRLQLIARFEIQGSGIPKTTLSWRGHNLMEEMAEYNFEQGLLVGRCLASFHGLFPHRIQIKELNGPGQLSLFDENSRIPDLKLKLSQALEHTTYLGPFRKEPLRVYRFPGGTVRNVGIGGAKAPELLAEDYSRRHGGVLRSVGDWFASHLGGWPLGIAEHKDTFSLVLTNPQKPSVEVNIADAGTGIAQVLPLVVQRFAEYADGSRNGLEIVEQPELHLHPGVHGDLADLYIDSLSKSSSQFIIETHSENFVLRIRRRVVEGKLDPKNVIIYWINDDNQAQRCVEAIHVLQNGDVDRWPSKIFAEDFEEVKAMRKAQEQNK